MRFTAVRNFSHDGKEYKAGKTYVGDEAYAANFVGLGDATTDGGDSEPVGATQPAETEVAHVGKVDKDKPLDDMTSREVLAAGDQPKTGATGGGTETGATDLEAAEKASGERLGRRGSRAEARDEKVRDTHVGAPPRKAY